jgi:copper chaperone CopZ
MNETILKVPDMSCGHCVATVENALEQVDGVEGVEISLDTKIVRISHFGTMDPFALSEAIESVGFTPELSN